MTRAEVRENLLVALDTLRTRKVRSGLTILGIVIGVTSVISVAAIIDGLNGYIEGVFVNLEPRIATAISNAQTAGKDVTAAQAAFNDLQSQVSTAQGATNGESAQILAQTPTGFPGNWPVFLAGRTNATNAHTDLHAAYVDAQHIRADLQ